jgi:RNA polymerase sigma-70 factor (ECF subfamily)
LIFREVEDRDLIAKARRGNVDAHNVLVSRWEKRVYNYLLRLVRNREDALDLTQDVFLKAFQNLKKLEDADRFPAWIFRIAHNEAYSMLRKNRPEGEFESEPRVAEASDRMYPIELSLAVESAMSRLSAEILSCPVSTVKSRLYTALDLLKDTLAPISMRSAE